MVLPTPEQMERVLIDAVAVEPDSELIDRPDWVQWRTPSSPRINHNVVARARLPADKVAARIAEVVAEHAERRAGFRWIVGPMSTNVGPLEAGLRELGFEHLARSIGMAMRIPAAASFDPIDGMTVHEMGPDDVGEYARITARAWERGPEFEEAVIHVARRSFIGPRRTTSWIARLHGEPVATSHLRLMTGLGYLQGGAVLPAFRGRGIYRALVHHRIAYLRAAGIDVVTIWANANTSGVACAKLGFSPICTAEFYELHSPG